MVLAEGVSDEFSFTSLAFRHAMAGHENIDVEELLDLNNT